MNAKRYLCIIILTYVFLGFAYAFIVPIFEAPDEPDHLGYIQYLVENHRLPLQGSPNMGGRLNDQPPLYYFVQSLLLSVRKFDQSSLPKTNPNFSWRNISFLNLFIHTPEDLFSLNKDIIILRLLRLVSLIPGILIIITTFKITTLIFPGNKSIGIYAAGINALIPQFIFISAAINNDILAAFFSSITVFKLLKFLKEEPKRYIDILIIGIFVSLGLLTKLTALFLIPFSLIILFLKYKFSRRFFATASIFIIPALIIGGWMFLRLYWVYLGSGSFSFLSHHEDYQLKLGFAYWHLFHSFWGWFGWGAFLFPKGWRIFYSVLALLSTLGIASLLILKNVKVKYDSLQLRLISMCLLAITILVLVITVVNFPRGQPQGRYLFPVVSVISIFIIVGIKRICEVARSTFLSRINFTLHNLILVLSFAMFLSNFHALYLIAALYY